MALELKSTENFKITNLSTGEELESIYQRLQFDFEPTGKHLKVVCKNYASRDRYKASLENPKKDFTIKVDIVSVRMFVLTGEEKQGRTIGHNKMKAFYETQGAEVEITDL